MKYTKYIYNKLYRRRLSIVNDIEDFIPRRLRKTLHEISLLYKNKL